MLLPETLEAVLTQRQHKNGLYLEESGDHLVLLKRGDAVLASWSQLGVEWTTIRQEADRHIRGKDWGVNPLFTE